MDPWFSKSRRQNHTLQMYRQQCYNNNYYYRRCTNNKNWSFRFCEKFLQNVATRRCKTFLSFKMPIHNFCEHNNSFHLTLTSSKHRHHYNFFSHPFEEQTKPFEWFIHPFEGFIHLFERFIHPFERFIHPFERLTNPFDKPFKRPTKPFK